MAYLKLCLLVALSLVAQSFQDDPIVDFCRRWDHQTAVVDGRLYIDGGQVAYRNIGTNYTNEYLIFSDLTTRSNDGFPPQYANLSKPANVPKLSGAHLWSDQVNKCFYQFGGEYSEGSPKDFSMWTYDVILDQWNETEPRSSDKQWQRPAYGAGTQVESSGMGYYYGGWISSRSTPGWKGAHMALSSIVQYDFTQGEIRNDTHPDGIGRAEGQLLYLPVSDNGILVYFGGVEDANRNGTYTAANMTKIHIYDISSSKWYSQTAAGDVPLARRQFCAGVTWPDDRSSFNIYLYGGYGFGDPAAFDDVYILSLPSFTYVKGYPLGGVTSNQFGHGGCSATVMNPNQMMVIGGWFPNSSIVDCDAPRAQGQHNMILGNNTGKQENGIWDKYDPNLTTYAVPTAVVAVIGGEPTGGATVTGPSTWDHNDLKVYYQLRPSEASRAATRALPATGSPSPSGSPKKKKNIGAIAGGVVGGLVVLIIVLLLVLFCLHRRKKAKKDGGSRVSDAPPTELPVTQFPQEMSASDASKYVSVHQRSEPNYDAHYSGLAPYHTRAPSYDHSSHPDATQSHHTASPHSTERHTSFQGSTYDPQAQANHHSPHHGEAYFADEHAAYQDQHASWTQQSPQTQQSPVRQRQHSYTSPISPQQPLNAQAQHQSQIYYPPPQEALQHPQPSRNPPPAEQRGSPANTQYSGETQHGNISTTTTPAHFYAQPVPGADHASKTNTGYH